MENLLRQKQKIMGTDENEKEGLLSLMLNIYAI